MLVSRYKIVDYKGETVNNGFVSYESAWKWIYENYTNEAIRELEFKVEKELIDERKSKT